MFDDLIRALEELEAGVALSVPFQIDDDGYFDRQCPWSECGFTFKVLFEDWRDKVPDEWAYCPFCRHRAEPTEFNTPEQIEYMKQLAYNEVLQRFDQGLRASAESFNHQPQRGFVTLRLEVSTPQTTIPMPPAAEEAMTLRIACEVCGCRFAVIGAGYFCPACGHNSAGQTFIQSLARARTLVASLSTIAALVDPDTRAQMTTALIESALGMLVTAFQRFAEAEYPHLPHPVQTPRRNAFQNLTEGSALWEAAGGTAYEAILNTQEMMHLQRLFQQRHLLAHREGIVDQEYVRRSGDATYAPGQRLVIREQSVLQLADLLEKLVSGMRSDLPS